MNAAQKADKAACIFYFNHDDTKRTRRANMLKELFGEHLLAICEKGDLFSVFNNIATKMNRVREMHERAVP